MTTRFWLQFNAAGMLLWLVAMAMLLWPSPSGLHCELSGGDAVAGGLLMLLLLGAMLGSIARLIFVLIKDREATRRTSAVACAATLIAWGALGAADVFMV